MGEAIFPGKAEHPPYFPFLPQPRPFPSGGIPGPTAGAA